MAEVWRRDLAPDDASSPSDDDRAPLAGLVVSCAPQDVPPLLWASCDSSEAMRSEEGSEQPSLRSVSSAASSEEEDGASGGDGLKLLPPPPPGRGRDPDEEDPYGDVRDRMEALCREDRHGPSELDMTTFMAVTTCLGYMMVTFIGHFRDWCAKAFRRGRYFGSNSGRNYPSDDLTKYASLVLARENFYTRRMYHRIQDCFNRPIASRPAATISVLERVSFDGNKTMSILGRLSNLKDKGHRDSYRSGKHYEETSDGRVVRRCLNLGSYNYLGFADDWDVTCREGVLGSLAALPSSLASSRSEFGTTSLHRRVETTIAAFVGKEDAVAFNMGFNTNATVIPALVSRGDLIVSDAFNHTSIVNGARASGASVRVFRHNDAADLERTLREAVLHGQPRTRRPWGRVLVVVEGVYSMEGELCDLRGVVRACKRYGAYVYLDEAHSIGAIGPTGRGCCEYAGVDPRDVDVLMGTFTKSFGAMGGYIAADRRVVDCLRRESTGILYHNSMSPVVCQQIISSFQVIMGEDGTDIGRQKLSSMRDNSNYFRMRLVDMGLHVLGDYDSPVIPVMLNDGKIAPFARECYKRGLAVVVVGFPAVPLLMSRARFCISAGHTREDLDRALAEIDEIVDLLKMRYKWSMFG